MKKIAALFAECSDPNDTSNPAHIHTQNDETDLSFNCYQAVKEAKAEAKENLQIVDSLYNSINYFCSLLDRLDNVTERLIFYEDKEKGK